MIELATEIQRQHASKRDFAADTRNIGVTPVEKGISLDFENLGSYKVNKHALNQIAERTGIPTKYAERMAQEAPELLARNVAHWFKERPETRMVRTLDGNARAFLSDRYRPLDNIDLATHVLPRLNELSYQMESSQITETRLYIAARTQRIQRDLVLNDPVQAGIVITNSEVGNGSLSVQAMIFRLVCLNGMITPTAVRSHHTGKKLVDFEGDLANYSDKTKLLNDAAFWSRVIDTVNVVCEEARFDKLVTEYRVKAGQEVKKPIETVELVGERFQLLEAERTSVLENLINGGSLTRWGLANAVTALANNVESYDRNIELQVLGGKIMELPQNDALFQLS